MTLEEIRKHPWYQSRPQVIKDMIEETPFNQTYRFIDSKHEVTIHAYNEDGTLIVQKTGKGAFVPALNKYKVFGVSPLELEPVIEDNE